MPHRFSRFAEALDYLGTCTDYERMSARYSPQTYNLKRTRRLLDFLENPHEGLPFVHVAGTKGKGSSALMTEAILRAHGMATGLFTSPHLVTLLERIQVDGKSIAPREFVWAMNRMAPVLDRLRPTFFEIMTAAAFLLFRSHRLDVAVIEVGLGGRLDSTNVITPAVSVITRIDYDHMEKLGHTLGAIAREKAGIIKAGIPVVTTERKPEPLSVIHGRAHSLDAPLWRLGREIRIKNPGSLSWDGNPVVECTVEFPGEPMRRLRLGVAGRHQLENAAAALAASRTILGRRFSFPRALGALRRLSLPGRIEVVARHPTIVVDGAHNPAAAQALARTLRESFPERRILVFGASADKDVAGMIRTLLPLFEHILWTRADNPRAASPLLLKKLGSTGTVVESVPRAVKLARKLAGQADTIVVTGSFYVAGEALAYLRS